MPDKFTPPSIAAFLGQKPTMRRDPKQGEPKLPQVSGKGYNRKTKSSSAPNGSIEDRRPRAKVKTVKGGSQAKRPR